MTLSEIGPILLVGAGKMGLALARGWLAGGLLPSSLVLVDPMPSDATIAFADEHGIRLLSDGTGILTHVVVLAVKPQIMAEVMAELAPGVGKHTLVLSIAAGISLDQIMSGLASTRVIRTMPNTPAQIGKGITGAVAGAGIGTTDKELAEALLAAAGEVVWFTQESALDAVTAVSGSGPAYVFHLVEALASAGARQGLELDDAMKLARATVIGAAALMDADAAPAAQLRANVTSPNGTTAAALKVLMAEDGLESLLYRTVKAARLRSEELGK